MVNAFQSLYQYSLGGGDVAEGYGTFLEVSLCHLRVDDAVYYVGDGLLRIFRQRARCRLHTVCHHQYGLLTAEGVGARVAERCLVHVFVGVLVLVCGVEILGKALSVVREDEVAYHVGHAVLLRQLYSFCHVTGDNLRALLWLHPRMRVHSGLVLGEEHGVGHLADVVVQCAGAHQEAFRTHFRGYG